MLIERLVSDMPPLDALDLPDIHYWPALYAGLALGENDLWQKVAPQHARKIENIRFWLRRIVEVGALPPVDRADVGFRCRLGSPNL